ncbi:protease-4 [Arboricoccus pini]|uniref:Protease-4 n=1 Tax=Arboricoccus pini TaxID=1963835 RepID=A0A212QW39_9PROT|nr:signal peptide peptidase SppA [Arboricoccus pini]SNB63934.1 protease-4 [Arboricoccus pini]
MWRFIRGFFAVIGLLAVIVLAVGLGGAYVAYRQWRSPEPLPAAIVLRLDLRQALAETPSSGLSGLTGPGLTVSDVVLTLDRAAADPHVKGVVALIDETEQGLAVTQELRDSILRLHAAGKWTIAWAESFGELSPANQAYYLATAFDEIDMMPSGTLGLTSLAVQTLNAKTLLDRLGVVLSVTQRESFKSAFETFTAAEPSKANILQLKAVLDDSGSQFEAGIAAGRRLDFQAAGAAMAGGPYTAAEAKAAGLVDNLIYGDQLMARIDDRANGVPMVDLDRYAADPPPAPDHAPGVALIRASGLIVRGEDDAFGRIAANQLADTLSTAIDDPAIKAIVLRLNSPGGSPVASDIIARQIHLAIEAGKPVIVSMGNVAASGGYWISMGATRIVAQPGTLTGSIGVVAAKPVIDGLMEKAGVLATTLTNAQNGAMWSMTVPYTPAMQARIDAIMDATYAGFKDGVAVGRKLDPAVVEKAAQGRVWTGQSALERGLVDRLGGLHDALGDARMALGLAPNAPLDIVPLPAPKSPLEQVRDLAQHDLGFLGTIQGLATMAQQALSTNTAPMISVH